MAYFHQPDHQRWRSHSTACCRLSASRLQGRSTTWPTLLESVPNGEVARARLRSTRLVVVLRRCQKVPAARSILTKTPMSRMCRRRWPKSRWGTCDRAMSTTHDLLECRIWPIARSPGLRDESERCMNGRLVYFLAQKWPAKPFTVNPRDGALLQSRTNRRPETFLTVHVIFLLTPKPDHRILILNDA